MERGEDGSPELVSAPWDSRRFETKDAIRILNELFNPHWRFSSDGDEKFRASFEMTGFGDSFVSSFSYASLNARRTPVQIARSTDDSFAGGFVLSGSGAFIQDEE